MSDEIEVVFADKNLEAAVRETLEKPKGPLTRGHLKRMKELGVADKAIEDLTGLEHAVNLTELHLRGNQISDVSSLASLTNLTTLSLRHNQISDVSPLASLTNLTELDLSNNQITDANGDGGTDTLSGIEGLQFGDGTELTVSTADGAEVQANTHVQGQQRYSSIAGLEDGGYIVTWTDESGQDGSGYGIYGQRYGASGSGRSWIWLM